MEFKTIDFKTKAVLGTVIAGLMLSSGAMAFAASDTSTAGNSKASSTATAAVQKPDGMPGMGHGPGGRGGDVGLFGQDAESSLAALVSKDIISQATADKISASIEAEKSERQAEMEKVKDMTDDERKAYFEDKRSNEEKPAGLLEQLVDDGILTQDQVDKIKEYNQQAMLEKQKEQLQTLVDKGTLISSDVDKILEYMSAHMEERQAEMEKVEDMTDDEKKAYFEEKKSSSEKPAGIFEQMVDDGVLTQEKADAIKDSFGSGNIMHGDFKKQNSDSEQ